MKRAEILVLAIVILVTVFVWVRRSTSQSKITLAFTASHALETEPCGCSVTPSGGLDLERAFWKANSNDVLYVSVGSTFVKDKGKASVDEAVNYAQAMNDLPLRVLSPGPQDLLLGSNSLRDLSRHTKFSWVNSDWMFEGRPLFERSLDIAMNGYSFFIVALGGPAKHVDVMEPDRALTSVFTSHSLEGKLVVLLSSLGKKENLELAKSFPQINVVVGDGSEDESSEIVSRTLLSVSAKAKAGSVGFVTFQSPSTPYSFFDEQMAPYFAEKREDWVNALSSLERAPGNHRDAVAGIVSKLSHLQGLYEKPAKSTEVSFRLIPLRP